MSMLPDGQHAVHAAEARVIVHARVLELIDKFLTYKRGSGTDIERSIYQSMTRDEFVARLICNRPLSFMSASDTTLLRTRVRPRGSDWFLVGMPSENESSIQMSSYLTYDEMAISALLGVSSPTTFINSGGRYNRGRKRSSGSFIRNGIVIGAVGCRFEQPGRMESQFIIVAMDDQPEGGELKSLWASLYDIHAFPSYNDVKTAVGAGSEDFAVLGPDSYFNVAAYKQRIALTIETVFADANDRATTAGKYAYVHVVGLGLGVWKVHASQPRWFVDAVADVLNRVRFPMIGIIDFSWFSLPSPATCGGAQHEDRLATPVGNSVQIRFSKRDPADPLSGIPPNSMLLVATYAWDGNAFPGNEIYTGSLCGSGDPATAACCTIYELHNPYINPYFGKVFTAPSSAT
ncbi:hypothetical protein PBRA_001217 [Plasmodiophora brassicae]|uniref:Uncharacterized protein n=1 Tax=Plasmodiophora brassicae TaxID=37360 RepID=A0A0G4IW69_PLABS|nr:hypothetical protein PBRA_001217 [Plasmodiophora brassicae]